MPAAAASAPASGRYPKAEPRTKPPPWSRIMVGGSAGSALTIRELTPPAFTGRTCIPSGIGNWAWICS